LTLSRFGVAAAAHAGPGSFVLWIVAALFFFLPSAIVVASLSRRFPEEGGFYAWTKQAFGDQHAFICSWFYFISTVLYFPSLLLAGISMAAYPARASPAFAYLEFVGSKPLFLMAG
jgi:amino acid transporter